MQCDEAKRSAVLPNASQRLKNRGSDVQSPDTEPAVHIQRDRGELLVHVSGRVHGKRMHYGAFDAFGSDDRSGILVRLLKSVLLILRMAEAVPFEFFPAEGSKRSLRNILHRIELSDQRERIRVIQSVKPYRMRNGYGAIVFVIHVRTYVRLLSILENVMIVGLSVVRGVKRELYRASDELVIGGFSVSGGERIVRIHERPVLKRCKPFEQHTDRPGLSARGELQEGCQPFRVFDGGSGERCALRRI